MIRDTEVDVRRSGQDARLDNSVRQMTPVPAATSRFAPRRTPDNPLDVLEARLAALRRRAHAGAARRRASPKCRRRIIACAACRRSRGWATWSSTAAACRHAPRRDRPDRARRGADRAVRARADAGVGDAVFNRGPFYVAPHASWRGRAIDALGPPDRRRPGAGAGRSAPTPRASHARRAVAPARRHGLR